MDNTILPHEASNSSLVKFGALCETKISGNPCCANVSLSLQAVAIDVVEFMMCVSIYFDVASSATRNILPRQRSSIIDVVHDFSDHSHGCSGAAGGDVLCSWHVSHF